MTARVGRRCGGGTEKHSGSRSAVTGVDERTDGWMDGWSGWDGWSGRENPDAVARLEKAVEFGKLDSLRRGRRYSEGREGKERRSAERAGGGMWKAEGDDSARHSVPPPAADVKG